MVDGCVAGGIVVTVASRNFPKQYLHDHIIDKWRGLARGTTDAGLVVGTIINRSSACSPSRAARRAMPPGRGNQLFCQKWRALMINILDFVHILGSGPTDSGLVVAAIAKAKPGLQPKMFGAACYAYWQDGDFTKASEW